MKKVMVYNFKTEKYEEATQEEGKEILALIDAMNADCANQQNMHRTACTHPEKKVIGGIPYCKVCGEQLD